MEKKFDVLVVGGGHAGAEAAYAAARMGHSVGLVTHDSRSIGRMSCNPAIGGVGKGQLAREIDALGGLMGVAADASGIQFRLLNTSKGRAVQSPRAQCCRLSYEERVQEVLENSSEIEFIDAEASHLLFNESREVRGLGLSNGSQLHAPTVVLCRGTFLAGFLFTGLDKCSGGWVGEAASDALSLSLSKLGLPVGRLKTGTPPRLAADSVDYAVMEEQPGDPTPVPFSFLTDSIDREQISCWITRTNSRTHQIVRENLQFAPMYTGRIEGKGPRYCPSLEDKVVRFQDRGQHTVFLEPEGIDSNVLYANGISTSLPVEAQNEFVRSIPGLEKAKIVQPGYAVEYTFVAPRVLRPNLEVDQYPGLFLAGQICGTSGYEEAAAQGLMAGLNAGLKLQKREPFILGRHEAYIGVLIDDLVVSDPSEPYRMFTSRAEHRLLLRHDTADRRLTPMAQKLGVVSQNRYGRMESRLARLAEAKEWLQKTPVPETSSTPSSPKRLVDLLRRTDTGIDSIQETLKLPQELGLSDEEWRILEADILYEGYVKRQQEWVEGSREREKASIPDGFDFQAVRGLRNEAKECLSRFQPATLGAAGRLAGISPSDVALMEVALRRENYL